MPAEAPPVAPSQPAPAAAPATAAPAKAAPSTPAASAPTKESASAPNEFDVEYDRIRGMTKKPEPATPKPDPGAAKKPDPETPEKAPEKAADKVVATAPKQLRELLEKKSRDFSDLETRHREMEKKIADAEAKGKDTGVMAERLSTLEKQLQEKESAIRALKFEASSEFKDKYEKPFNRAAAHAQSQVEQLSVYEHNEADPNNPKQRPATWDDFRQLFSMPLSKALVLAKKAFGEGSSIVEHHLTKLKDLDYQQIEALKDEREAWEERQKADTAKAASEREATERMWATVNKDIAEKRPEWFQADPDDPDDKKLLNEGYALVDPAFVARDSLSQQQRVILDANIRHRAANFGRMVRQRDNAMARIAELESKLKEFQESEPGKETSRQGEQPAVAEKSIEDDLRESLRE